MQELYLLSKLILKKINKDLDSPRIETIRFQCLEKKKEKKEVFQEKVIAIKKQIPLNSHQAKALSKINDQELSQELEKFLQKCQQ